MKSGPNELVDEELALEAAQRAFVAAVTGTTFPVVIGHSADPNTRFTLKSGAMHAAVGVKIGSYWPKNDELGLSRHGSTIVLLDEATGRLAAVVEAAAANAYRTAAADALAVSVLARPDAEVDPSGHRAPGRIRDASGGTGPTDPAGPCGWPRSR